MEELLNKLIEKGWKPRGKEVVEHLNSDQGFNDIGFSNNKLWFYTGVKHITDEGEGKILKIYNEYKLRELVSKESGLWQFVCKNRLWKDIDEEKYWHKKTPKMSELRSYDYHFEEFRIIESSLKDESELGQFLLDNIKV